MERSVSLDLKQVSIKCRSKKELYDLLVSDWGIYLPPIQFANSSYVRGIVTGEIKVRFNQKAWQYSFACKSKRCSDH